MLTLHDDDFEVTQMHLGKARKQVVISATRAVQILKFPFPVYDQWPCQQEYLSEFRGSALSASRQQHFRKFKKPIRWFSFALQHVMKSAPARHIQFAVRVFSTFFSEFFYLVIQRYLVIVLFVMLHFIAFSR